MCASKNFFFIFSFFTFREGPGPPAHAWLLHAFDYKSLFRPEINAINFMSEFQRASIFQNSTRLVEDAQQFCVASEINNNCNENQIFFVALVYFRKRPEASLYQNTIELVKTVQYNKTILRLQIQNLSLSFDKIHVPCSSATCLKNSAKLSAVNSVS